MIEKHNEIHTTSIRVSGRLIDQIKKCADETGASVNSTICVLLDLGLKAREGISKNPH